MTLGWLKPNKYNLILFVVISVLLFFLPVVPTLSAPVVLEPIYTWDLKSPVYSLQSVDIVGVSNKYFGVFTGADAAMVSIAFTLLIAYLVSCALIYLFKKPPKIEKQAEFKSLGKPQ
jgi:hypothetical protein